MAALLAVGVVDLAAPGGALAGARRGASPPRWPCCACRAGGAADAWQPILAVLHLAYLMVPVSLAVKAAHLLGGASWAANWLHLQAHRRDRPDDPGRDAAGDARPYRASADRFARHAGGLGAAARRGAAAGLRAGAPAGAAALCGGRARCWIIRLRPVPRWRTGRCCCGRGRTGSRAEPGAFVAGVATVWKRGPMQDRTSSYPPRPAKWRGPIRSSTGPMRRSARPVRRPGRSRARRSGW